MLYTNFAAKHLSFKCGTEDPGTELYKQAPNLKSLYYHNYACSGENATCLQIIRCIYLPAYFPRPVSFISRKPTPKSHFPFSYVLYTCQLRLSLWYLVIKIRYHRLEMWDSSWEVKWMLKLANDFLLPVCLLWFFSLLSVLPFPLSLWLSFGQGKGNIPPALLSLGSKYTSSPSPQGRISSRLQENTNILARALRLEQRKNYLTWASVSSQLAHARVTFSSSNLVLQNILDYVC